MLTIYIVTNDINKFFGRQLWNGKAYLLEVRQNGITRYFAASGVDCKAMMRRNYEELYKETNDHRLRKMLQIYEKSPIEWEVLVFPSTENGEMKTFGVNVAGGSKMTYREAIEDLRKEIRKYGIKKVWSAKINEN